MKKTRKTKRYKTKTKNEIHTKKPKRQKQLKKTKKSYPLTKKFFSEN